MSSRSITPQKSTAAIPKSNGIAEGPIAKSSLFALLEQAPAPICIFKGPEHRFEFVNPLYARLFANRDLAGKTIREALPELEGQDYFELLDRVYETGKPSVGREAPARIDRNGDGQVEEAFFNFIYQPMQAPDGAIDGIMVFAFEVTDLVLSRRQAEALAASLQAANREKEDFIAAISHELRTPLTSILGWTRMVQLGDLDAETYRSALDSIERSTKAQAQLIEDLLDESRIAAGKLGLNLQTLGITNVIEAAIDTVSPLARKNDVRLETNLPSQPILVRGDPIRLQQVITNLLSNAIKFTNPGSAVTLSLAQSDMNAVLTVIDTGRGIRPDFLPHVFDRFRQDDTTSSERRGGLGLGLSIVKHLVELHGGSVRAASDGDGKGSTFTVELPLVTTAGEVSSLKERDDGDRYSSLPSLSGVKVLIVEDEIDNRAVLAAVLRRCGADVDLATTARQGLERVRNWRPDVILSDVMLPDGDGCSLMRDVRALADDRGGRTPAMALSVHARPDERERAMDAGFAIFRQKPIEPADLAFDIARLARPR